MNSIRLLQGDPFSGFLPRAIHPDESTLLYSTVLCISPHSTSWTGIAPPHSPSSSQPHCELCLSLVSMDLNSDNQSARLAVSSFCHVACVAWHDASSPAFHLLAPCSGISLPAPCTQNALRQILTADPTSQRHAIAKLNGMRSSIGTVIKALARGRQPLHRVAL